MVFQGDKGFRPDLRPKVASFEIEKQLGRGALGTVFLIRTPERKTFALKKYFHQQAAKIAFDNYRMAKDAEMDTPEFVSVDESSNSLIISDLTEDGVRECYDAKHRTEKDKKLKVVDIDGLLEKVCLNAEKATSVGIMTPPDAILFIVEGGILVDITIGDFDYVRKAKDLQNLHNLNLDNLLRGFAMFLHGNVENYDDLVSRLEVVYERHSN